MTIITKTAAELKLEQQQELRKSLETNVKCVYNYQQQAKDAADAEIARINKKIENDNKLVAEMEDKLAKDTLTQDDLSFYRDALQGKGVVHNYYTKG